MLTLLAVLAAGAGCWLAVPPRRGAAGVTPVAHREAPARRWLPRRSAPPSGGAGELCLALAGELRAGRYPDDALARAASAGAGPVAQAALAAARALRLGAEPAAAFPAVPPVLAQLGGCWVVSRETGAPLAAVVECLATELVARERLVAARRTELAGPRAAAGLLAGLPLAGVALAGLLGARPLHVLAGTPVGLACTAAATVLDLAGWRWLGALAAADR